MDAPSPRPVAAIRWVAVALFASLLAADGIAVSSLPPAGIQPISIPFFVDHRLGDAMKPSLDEAVRRLSDSRCQEVLTDFSDLSGRRLDANLRAINQSMPSYLGLVLFYDGRSSQPCEKERVLAWTSPGSRAVQICWNQFSRWQRVDTGYTANVLIHETLHTLGLGELPPAPGQITARVIARCGR